MQAKEYSIDKEKLLMIFTEDNIERSQYKINCELIWLCKGHKS